MKTGLISFHTFSQPGGVKNHILGLCKELKKKGIETKIIVPRRKMPEKYGKDVILLGTSFPLPFSGSKSDFCVNFNWPMIDKTLKKEKFDVLHFHNFGFPSAFQILEQSRALNILTFHANIEKSEFFKTFPELLYAFKKIVQWKMDGIIGVAPLNLKIFKDFSGPKAVIPNGIDLKKFNPRKPKIKKFSGGKLNILFVGRIEKRKGLIYLLKAYEILSKKFSDLRLIIVGDGNLKDEYQQWVKEHNLKEVYFEGETTDKKIPSYFTTADIFVSPAIFGESFGIVLVEAMACGTPVVAFSNQGYKELLKGKKGGKFLVPTKKFKMLSQKIELLIKKKDLREKMAKWGIEEAKNYSWEKIAGQVSDFYQLCAKNRNEKQKDHQSLKKILQKKDRELLQLSKMH